MAVQFCEEQTGLPSDRLRMSPFNRTFASAEARRRASKRVDGHAVHWTLYFPVEALALARVAGLAGNEAVPGRDRMSMPSAITPTAICAMV